MYIYMHLHIHIYMIIHIYMSIAQSTTLLQWCKTPMSVLDMTPNDMMSWIDLPFTAYVCSGLIRSLMTRCKRFAKTGAKTLSSIDFAFLVLSSFSCRQELVAKSQILCLRDAHCLFPITAPTNACLIKDSS